MVNPKLLAMMLAALCQTVTAFMLPHGARHVARVEGGSRTHSGSSREAAMHRQRTPLALAASSIPSHIPPFGGGAHRDLSPLASATQDESTWLGSDDNFIEPDGLLRFVACQSVQTDCLVVSCYAVYPFAVHWASTAGSTKPATVPAGLLAGTRRHPCVGSGG
jgi:hypothetical protein